MCVGVGSVSGCEFVKGVDGVSKGRFNGWRWSDELSVIVRKWHPGDGGHPHSDIPSGQDGSHAPITSCMTVCEVVSGALTPWWSNDRTARFQQCRELGSQ